MQANRIALDATLHFAGYSVCLCPIKRIPGLYGLTIDERGFRMFEQRFSNAYAEIRFSHDAAHISYNKQDKSKINDVYLEPLFLPVLNYDMLGPNYTNPNHQGPK